VRCARRRRSSYAQGIGEELDASSTPAGSCGRLHGGLHSGAMNANGDKVRLGVIGCGMVCDSYLETLQRFDHVAFAACADLLPERARRVAAEYGFGRACSVDELVRGDDTDLVLNLTIPATHAELNLAALDRGMDRGGEVLAVGGGAVCDVAGFALCRHRRPCARFRRRRSCHRT
jgi:hypothetical protein